MVVRLLCAGIRRVLMLRLVVPLIALVALCACAGTDNYAPKGEPSFYRNLAQPGAELDAAAAASMISGYRANNGLSVVALDPELMLGKVLRNGEVGLCGT